MISKEDLIREYGAMQSRIENDIAALRREKKEWLKRECNRVRQEHKTAFAVRLVAAREEGMKREDLLKVLNTQRGDVLKAYVEMGGGQMKKLRTADERIAEIEEAYRATMRYRMDIVDFDQSSTGKGLMITTFEGEALPEPVTFKIMERERNGTFFIMGSPDFPEWWDKMMRDGEYARFDAEVNEFLRREMGE